MNETELLEHLADCLCVTIKESPGPDVCFCGVIFGDGVVGDYAGGCRDGRQGMAWVRMVSMYPADGINVVNERVNNCGSSIGMDLEVGILRPVAVTSGSRGQAPTANQYLAAAARANDDAKLMLHAIRCCVGTRDWNDIDSIVGVYQPAGPEGGLMGGTWPMAVILD